MSTKVINRFMAYANFGVGSAKFLYVIFLLIQLGTLVANVKYGRVGETNFLPEIGIAIGVCQLALGIASLIMLCVNFTKQPEVILGYFLSIGALALQYIVPSNLMTYAVFVQCIMYMSAGIKIKKANGEVEGSIPSRKSVKASEWFYKEEQEKQDKKVEQKKEESDFILTEDKKQEIIKNLEPEIIEWKKLLEQGMIDQITYDKETNKLIQKAIKKYEKLNK